MSWANTQGQKKIRPYETLIRQSRWILKSCEGTAKWLARISDESGRVSIECEGTLTDREGMAANLEDMPESLEGASNTAEGVSHFSEGNFQLFLCAFGTMEDAFAATL